MNAHAACCPVVIPTRRSVPRRLAEAALSLWTAWRAARDERHAWRALQELDGATRRDLGLPERAAPAPDGRARWLRDPWG